VSLRLVPGQTYAKVGKQLERAVASLAPRWAEVKVNLLHGGDPVRVDVDHPAFEVLDEAFASVTGRPAVRVRSGGSIPIIPDLGLTGAPVLLTGIGLPDDGLHSPNEKLDLAQLWSGIEIFGRFFELFAEKGARAGAVSSPLPEPVA
jgi:amidohydrolase